MSGIESIIEMINTKTAEKEKEILDEAEKHKEQKMSETKQKAKEISDAITAKAEIESAAEIGRYEASAKLKSKYQLLEAKEALIDEIITSVKKELEGMAGKKVYGKILERLAVDAATPLEETDLEMVLPKGHASLITLKAIEDSVSKITGKKTKIKVSKEAIRSSGGVLVRTLDNTRWVDNTFEDRYVRLESAIRDTIAEILFSSDKKEK